MKIRIILFLVCLVQVLSAQKWDNRQVNLKGKRILVFTKNGKGYVHDNISASVDAFFKMGRENDFRVDTSSNASLFTEENLIQYNAIVFSNTNNEVFENESQKVAFMRYIQAGGGFIGIHSACGTERNWSWFKKMLGGTFAYHPPFQAFNVYVVDREHPCSKNIPETWLVKDELYILKEFNPTVRVLMVSDFSMIDAKQPMPETFGNVYPSVWCNDFDGGRQWFTALGHDKSDYSNPLYLSHLLGGLKWVTADSIDMKKASATKSGQ